MFQFYKRIIASYQLSGTTLFDKGFEYNLTDDSKLLFTGQDYWILYGTKKYLVNKAFLVEDLDTSGQMGHYEFTNWNIINGYNDKLFWQGEQYQFKKIKPEIRHSLFNRETWGHFKFQLSKDNEIVTYRFKIETPAIAIGNLYTDKSFEGTIEIEGVSPVVALAGLVLVERALDNEAVV